MDEVSEGMIRNICEAILSTKSRPTAATVDISSRCIDDIYLLSGSQSDDDQPKEAYRISYEPPVVPEQRSIDGEDPIYSLLESS